MFRRLVSLMFVVMLCMSATVSMAEHTYSMAGFDGQDSSHDWQTNGFFTRMQEKTGLVFETDQYIDQAEWQKAKDTLFQTGDLPDVLFKASLSSEELIRYTQSGQLIDLLPLLEVNAPNLWALLCENPQWLSAITLPSGKVGALPTIQTASAQNALWINQEWLLAVGEEMPTDFDSLQKVLQAFRDKDPNQNGKQDEVPLSFLGPWDLKFFAHAYGAVANDYNVYVDEQGNVQFLPAEERYLSMVKELAALFDQKLIDQEGFITADQLRVNNDDDSDVRYGAFFAPTPLSLLTFDQAENYVVVPPFVYEGKQVYRDVFGCIIRGSFAITSACEEPEKMLQWVDHLYSTQGAIEAMLGYEDVNYTIDENGYWQYKGGLETLSVTELSELSIYDTGNMPWCFPQAFYEQYEQESVRRVSNELNELDAFLQMPFPPYTLTPEQREMIVPLQIKLGAYVDESLARFVTGEWAITDETIASYQAGLQEHGMQEMIDFWQGIYEDLTRS